MHQGVQLIIGSTPLPIHQKWTREIGAGDAPVDFRIDARQHHRAGGGESVGVQGRKGCELGAGLGGEQVDNGPFGIGQRVETAVALLSVVRGQLPAAFFADEQRAVDQRIDETALGIYGLGKRQRVEAAAAGEIELFVLRALPRKGKGAISAGGQLRPVAVKNRFCVP